MLDLDGCPRPLQAEQQTAEVTVGADGFTRLPVQPLDRQLARCLLGPEHLLVELPLIEGVIQERWKEAAP